MSVTTHRGGPGGAAHPTAGFAVACSLNAGFLLVELAMALYANSMALAADAVHNLSDVMAIALAWGAAVLAGRKPTAARSYGLRKVGVLVALTNSLMVFATGGGIVWGAVGRLFHPQSVNGAAVSLVAGLGVVVNASSALVLMKGRRRDLNVHAAFLHLVYDAGVSMAVMASAIVMARTGWKWVDPAASIVVSAVIVAGTWSLLRRSIDMTLDAVPPTIDLAAVRKSLLAIPGVVDVHDLHVWAISTSETALTAHLTTSLLQLDTSIAPTIAAEMDSRFGIGHVTLQYEHVDSVEKCPQKGAAHYMVGWDEERTGQGSGDTRLRGGSDAGG